MKNKTLWIVVGIIMIIVIVALSIYKNQQKYQSDNDIKIGVILPLSGATSELGKNALAALQIAEEVLNRQDPTKPQIKLIIEDGKYSSKDTINAYNKLKLDGIKSLIVLGDVPNLSVANFLSKDELPCIALVANAQNVPGLSPWMFRGWYCTDDATETIADFLSQNKLSRTAALCIKNNFGDEFEKSAYKYFVPKGSSIVASESFDMDDLDIRTQVKKALSSNPDNVLLIGFGPSYIAAYSQLREFGYNGPIITETTIAQKYYYENIKGNKESIYYVDAIIDENDETFKLFEKQFTEKRGEDVELFSSFSFVVLQLLKIAIDENGVEPNQILKGLQGLHNISTFIGEISFQENGDLSMPLKIKKLDK